MSSEKRRGRSSKSILTRCRAIVWYRAVKSREGLSDYQLGLKFARMADDLFPEESHSPRIFESIRRNAAIPSRGKHRLRKYDLVKLIDSDPTYTGTADLMDSPFWELMQCSADVQGIREIVVECVIRLSLATHPGDYEDDLSTMDLKSYLTKSPQLTIEEFDSLIKMGDDAYDQAMALAFPVDPAPSLDYIALFGALAMEAVHAGKLRIAKYQSDIFAILLSRFCRQEWMGEYFGDEFYQEIMERMNRIIYADRLAGQPFYPDLLKQSGKFNSGSPVVAFLKRHERLLWGRSLLVE